MLGNCVEGRTIRCDYEFALFQFLILTARKLPVIEFQITVLTGKRRVLRILWFMELVWHLLILLTVSVAGIGNRNRSFILEKLSTHALDLAYFTVA